MKVTPEQVRKKSKDIARLLNELLAILDEADEIRQNNPGVIDIIDPGEFLEFYELTTSKINCLFPGRGC